jgi:hypothetical protein
MAPASSRAAGSDLPRQARFLRRFSSTPKEFVDLEQWCTHIDALFTLVQGSSDDALLQLVSNSELRHLLPSCLAHGLELFVIETAVEASAAR